MGKPALADTLPAIPEEAPLNRKLPMCLHDPEEKYSRWPSCGPDLTDATQQIDGAVRNGFMSDPPDVNRWPLQIRNAQFPYEIEAAKIGRVAGSRMCRFGLAAPLQPS